jgi:hypothetical protein
MSRIFAIDEGQLSIPETWQDQTLNVLADKTTGPGFTLTIARDRLPWGMSFDAYAEHEFSKVSNSFKEFVEHQRAQTTIAGATAHLIDFHWKANVGPVHQILVIVSNGEKALIFTGSNPGEMNNAQKKNFLALLNTFVFKSTS